MKKLNKKGFTLIELLAVIVILAVLMLLAAPSVLGIMNNARKNAVATEAMAIINAAKTKYAADSMGTVESSSGACYGLYDLQEYLDKDFEANAKALVDISLDSKSKATYKVKYYNGQYSVNGSGSIDGKIVEEGLDGYSDSVTCSNGATPTEGLK